MTLTRFKPIAKLALLFGTPLAVVFGLFSAGVYCGVQNREAIGAFERDWLGLPGLTAAGSVGDGATASSDAGAPSPVATPAEGEPSTEDAEPERVVPPPALPAPPELTPKVPPSPPEPTGSPERPSAAPVTTEPQPLEGAQAELFGTPVVLSVKVLVDPRLVEAQPAWIDHVQRVVDEASQVFAKQFGIALQLESVGRWRVGAAGMTPTDLRADLRTQPREGADLVLGLAAAPAPGMEGEAWRSEPPSDGPYNRAHGVAFAMPGSRPHLRSMLREISTMLGARVLEDAGDAAEHAESWMSSTATPGSSFWIDPPNRARILQRKVKPFASETPREDASEGLERNVDGTED